MNSTAPRAVPAHATGIEHAAPDSQEAKSHSSQPPTSPTLAQLVSQPLLDAKDRRAYEVARQRAKRPEDRRKARDKKAKHALVGGQRPRVADVVVVEDATDAPGGAARGAAIREAQSQPGYETESILAAHEVTVCLEDLVRIAKVRKAKAGDFELIPHVRAVVALDDFDFAGDAAATEIPDFEFDDWEHVESCSSSSDEDETRPKAPSYAQVVSNVNH